MISICYDDDDEGQAGTEKNERERDIEIRRRQDGHDEPCETGRITTSTDIRIVLK